MSTLTLTPASSNAAYPPDFRTVAEHAFVRLLKRDNPRVSLDMGNTWLTFYTLKNLTVPPFTQFPTENHANVDRALRQFQRSVPLRDTVLNYGLADFNLAPGTHVGFYRAASTVQENEEIQALECQHIVDIYKDFKSTLELAYRQQLADYWTATEQGSQRRELFIAEHKKALLLESEVAVEQGLLTTSQHAMLNDTLEQTGSTVQKHGVFHLTLTCGEGPPEVFPGAFVLTHAQSLEPPELKDNSLGEVILYTEHQGLEGFESLAILINSLDTRFNDTTQRQVLLQNLSSDQRQRIFDRTPGATRWGLTVMSANVLQALFDLQVSRQQNDFSRRLREARDSTAAAEAFIQTLPKQLSKAAHLDNAFMLDRNDQRVVGSNMPHWWSETDHEHQQHWVEAAQQYGKAIIQMHYLCANPPVDPPAAAIHQTRWLEHVKQLAAAQLQMGQIETQAQRFPEEARAWIKTVIESPDVNDRQSVDGKTVRLDFMALEQHTLADVMRIAPVGTGANDPLVICTFNAPDSKVLRWYPNMATMREHFLENPDFARYLLLQLPEESRPVECTPQQYEQWLKHFRAGDTFKHLSAPAALPSFSFGEPAYVDQGQDYLITHHDLKHAHRTRMRLRTTTLKNHGSLLAGVALNIAMLFIPSPILITMAVGVGLFKAWQGFRHVADGDYKGAAVEFLCATGYLAAAAVGKWMIDSKPFTALENLHSAPPLVRRTAVEGEEQISYLMSLEHTPHAAGIEVTAVYNAVQFRAIEINGQSFFVKRQPWLFGHCQLFRVAAGNPDLLIGETDYAVEDSLGVWRKVLSLRNAANDRLLQQSDLELGSLTRNWPDTVEKVSKAAKSSFERSYLMLAHTSNAEELPEIADYCEGGSHPINTLLRAGLHTPMASRFLSQFYRLHEYQGLAFRAAMVSPAGLNRLTSEIGQVFIDNGVQSASMSRWNAELWSRDEYVLQSGTSANKVVYVIFDTCVPKKNLFTGFLGDHVAVAPATPLQLVASRLVGKRFYVFFKRPLSRPTHLFSLYSGNTELML